MAAINRVRVAWTGFVGAPGVSTFYFLDAANMLGPLQSLFTTVRDIVPATVNLQVENAGDIIEDTTGGLTGSWTAPAQPGLQSVTSGLYAGPAGAAITWVTTSVLDKHRVKGRTFLVPLQAAVYDNVGSLTAATLSGLEAAAAAFVTATAGNFVVFHRPRVARAATATRPAQTARVGGHAIVTGSRVTDKAAVLRSRRD